jgi:hypothetical protein
MEALTGTFVTQSQVSFTGVTGDPFMSEIALNLTYDDGTVWLSGGYSDEFPDGYTVVLHGVAVQVPEPGTVVLLGLGIAGLVGRRKR